MIGRSVSPDDRQQHLQRACWEVEGRLRAGQRRVAEQLLDEHAELAESTESALELIYTEYTLLEEMGECPQAEELLHRFPQWRERLERLMRIHATLSEGVGPFDEWQPQDTPVAVQSSSTVSESARSPTQPRTSAQLDGFELLEEIGRGGMGVVYKARQVDLDRIVAVKMIRSPLAEDDLRVRFRVEAEAAARLQHANIVQIYEVGEHDDCLYFSMEYVEGASLDRRIAGQPLPEPQAAELVETLARAMEYSHRHGVVHRDLKPGNVILRADGMPKITDFGLAKRSWDDESRQTRSGAILGTPGYMAPEQAEGDVRSAVPAVDVHALGAMLYELLTGRPPFHGATLWETLQQVREQDPVAPSRLRPKLSRDLETICIKCLQKSPAARYATAGHLADDLHRFLSGDAIAARPVGPVERAGKWARRRPAIVALLSAVVFIALGGLTGIFWQWTRAESKRQEAELALGRAKKSGEAERSQRERLERNLYFHLVALAHREWLADHPLRAEKLLESSSSSLRGWEWSYLNGVMHSEVATLQSRRYGGFGLAFSPNGQLLACTTGEWASKESGEVLVWDVVTGAQRFAFGDNRGPVMDVAFSSDGLILAASGGVWGGNTGEVKLWNLSSGDLVATLEPEGGFVYGVAFSPNGKQLAASSYDGSLRVWDVASRREIATQHDHQGAAWRIGYSPDGRMLATVGQDGRVLLRDAATAEVTYVLDAGGDVRCLCFHPGGRELAVATWSGSVRIWNIQNKPVAARTIQIPGENVNGLAYSPDGQHLAVPAQNGTLHVLDVKSGQEIRKLLGHTGPVYDVAYSPTGRLLASSGNDGLVKIWDRTQKLEPSTVGYHPAQIAAITYHPGGQLLALGGGPFREAIRQGNPTIRIWDLRTERLAHRFIGHNDWLTDIAFSPDGRRLASASQDKTIKLWALGSTKPLLNLEGHQAAVTSVSFDPLSNRLCSASRDGSIKLWDLATGRNSATLAGHDGAVLDVAFSPNGRWLLSGGDDQMLRLWDATSARQIMACPAHQDSVTDVAFAPKMNWLATGSRDMTAKLWKLSFKDSVPCVELHRQLSSHMGPITGIAFDPQGQRLATCAEDFFVTIWDTETGAEAITLTCSDLGSSDIAFSPDGTQLSAAQPGGVTVWNARLPTRSLSKILAELDPQALVWHDQQLQKCIETANWHGMSFHVNHLLPSRPSDPNLRYCLADALMRLGRPEPASEEYLKAVELTRAHEPHSPDDGLRVAASCLNSGVLQRQLGHLDKAAEILQGGLDYSERLVTQFPEHWHCRRQVVDFHAQLGHAYKDHRLWKKAEDTYRNGIDLIEAYLERSPDDRWAKDAKAHFLVNLTVPLRATRRNVEAEQACHRTISLQQELLVDFPGEAYHLMEIALALEVIGEIRRQKRDHAEAERYFREALTIREQVVRKHPDVARWVENLSRSYSNLARVFQNSDKPIEAEQSLRKAIAHSEDALALAPTMRQHRAALDNYYRRLTHLLDKEGRPSEDVYRRMLSVKWALCNDQPTDTELNELAWNLVAGPFPHLYDPPAAIGLARKAVDRMPTTGAYWNTLGAAYYRNGNLQKAREAFAASLVLTKGGDSFDWFFLAMLDWQSGEKETARQWYERAVQWMESNKTIDPTLLRLKAEAQRQRESSLAAAP